MKEAVAKALMTVADDMGCDAKLYENYSGRGMYGKTTFGVVVEPRHFYQLVAAAAVQVYQEAEDLDGSEEPEGEVLATDDFIREMSAVKSDNMGRDDLIFY